MVKFLMNFILSYFFEAIHIKLPNEGRIIGMVEISCKNLLLEIMLIFDEKR
jgi:hypothetical protein